MHPFIGEAGRCKERAKRLDRLCPVACLLLELAERRGAGLLAPLELPRAELEELTPDRHAPVSNKDEPTIVADRDDRDGAWMAHHVLHDGTPLGGDCPSLDPEDGPFVRDRDLRFGYHCPDHTSMATAERHAQSPSAEPDRHGDAPVRVKALEKSFGRQRVLRGVTLAFPRGRTTVVLGPSGCGKSVLLKHLIGLLRPDAGSVHYEGVRVDALSERKLGPIRREFGFLFQQGALFDSMSVRDNIAFPLREFEGRDAEREEERVRRVLRLVGLEETIEKYPSELSGGQQKRVALARAIVLGPKVILYDEPTTGLDPIRSDVINELILKLEHELRVTSIVVTHDLASAFKVADHMVMLHEGQVVAEGSPEEFRGSTNPVVARFLRGEASEDELKAIREVTSANVDAARIKGEGGFGTPRPDGERAPSKNPKRASGGDL